MTTPMGRAMAGLLVIFAEFDREIFRERTRACLVQAWQTGNRLGRPMTAGLEAAEIRKLHRVGITKSLDRPVLADRPHISAADSGSKVVKSPK